MDNSAIHEVPIAGIQVRNRHRSDFGDISGLAESIDRLGLLQPIGITPDRQLIFGARRIEAFKALGWDHIPARILDVQSIMVGEYDENEVRKEFTPSEKVAIARAIKDELGSRQGKRTDLLRDLSPEVRNRRTRDIVAERARFGSGKQYERTKTVVDNGAPELVAAVDAGKVAIKPAAEFAKQNPQKQTERIKECGGNIVDAVRRFRESLPTKQEARKVAAESPPGTAILGRDGKWHTSATDEDRAKTDLYLRLADALRSARDLEATPEQLVGAVPKQSGAIFGPLVDQAAAIIVAVQAAWRSRHAA